MPRPVVFALIVAALAITATAQPAKLHLSFADAADPNPARIEIAATMLGLGLELLVSWTRHGQ